MLYNLCNITFTALLCREMEFRPLGTPLFPSLPSGGKEGGRGGREGGREGGSEGREGGKGGREGGTPFSRTKWFYIHVKTVIFHLSVWIIGQSGWKFCSRCCFDSRQFEGQAESRRWAANCKFCHFFCENVKFLIQSFTSLPND